MRAQDEQFRQYVLVTQRRLIRLADMLTGDHARAEDLVQQAYVKTYLNWHRVRAQDPEAYTRAIIVNANVDWWRRRSAHERLDAAPPDRPHAHDPTAEIDQRDEVMRALALLTRRERAVVVLKYYCDLPEQAIATELGCALGTVKSTAARALSKLKGTLVYRPEVRL
jgi:RNA polymerase sigma-70 factor (sigma-E family)